MKKNCSEKLRNLRFSKTRDFINVSFLQILVKFSGHLFCSISSFCLSQSPHQKKATNIPEFCGQQLLQKFTDKLNDKRSHHMKTSSLIGKANSLTGFYLRETFSVKGSKKTALLKIIVQQIRCHNIQKQLSGGAW